MKKGVLLPALALLIFAAIMLFVALAIGMMIARMIFSDSLPGALFALELANVYNLLYTVPGNVEFYYPGNAMCKWNSTGMFYRCGNNANVTGISRSYHSEYWTDPVTGEDHKDQVFYITFINLSYKIAAMDVYSIPAIYHPSMLDGCFLTYSYLNCDQLNDVQKAILQAIETVTNKTIECGGQTNLYKDPGFDNKTGVFLFTKTRYHTDTLCDPAVTPGLDHLIASVLGICLINSTGQQYFNVFLNVGQAIDKVGSRTICEYISPVESNFYAHWDVAVQKYCFDFDKFSNSNTSCNGYQFDLGNLEMPYYEGEPWWNIGHWGWSDKEKRPVYVRCLVKVTNDGNKHIRIEREGECEFITACDIGVKC
jgi:hypothetical protein